MAEDMEKYEKKSTKKRWDWFLIYWGTAAVLLVVAVAGFLLSDRAWYDAIYFAIQLFALEYPDVENVHWLVYVCRMLCAVMTATALLTLARGLRGRIRNAFNSMWKDATAIYYDNEEVEKYAEKFKHPVLMKDVVNKRVNSHVLLFEKDTDNLTFSEKLKNGDDYVGKVYIKLDKVESRLLKNSKAYYFNINEIIARTYWQERNLMRYLKRASSSDSLNVKIGIIGFGILGRTLLDYGLMNNIYSLNQNIQYHIWGDSLLYNKLLGNFDMMNGDTITYHDEDWREALETLKTFDRIIVALEPDVEFIQTLLYLNCDADIDVYNPRGIKLAELYDGRLTGFGILDDIVTEDNIKKDKLYRLAKKINYDYLVNCDEDEPPTNREAYKWDSPGLSKLMQKKWDELSGFKKGSNVASADYHSIRRMVLGMNKEMLSEDEYEKLTDDVKGALAEMEHIRWCRYHYVNHWRHDKIRNDKKRCHPLLKRYAELGDEQNKDIKAIKGLLTNKKMNEK